MLCAGVVVDAMQAALEDRKDALHTVCRDRFPRILSRTVVDRPMVEEQPAHVVVGSGLVAVDARPDLNPTVNMF